MRVFRDKQNTMGTAENLGEGEEFALLDVAVDGSSKTAMPHSAVPAAQPGGLHRCAVCVQRCIYMHLFRHLP